MSWIDSDIPGVERVRISDVRTVHVQLSGVPALRTTKGNAPISPHYAAIEYSITRHELVGIVVHGYPPAAHATATVRRRIKVEDLNSAPQWVQQLVKEHAP